MPPSQASGALQIGAGLEAPVSEGGIPSLVSLFIVVAVFFLRLESWGFIPPLQMVGTGRGKLSSCGI